MRNAAEERLIRISGSVKNFDKTKGFGFIRMKNMPNVFLHIQGAKVPGTAYPQEEDILVFTLKENHKGPFAADWEFEDKRVAARRLQESGSTFRKREPRIWGMSENKDIRVWKADE
jgi:cold shock CspA family protein